MTDCILTSYATDPKGYGKCNVVRFGKKITRAHILAWVDANGCLPPSENPLILHSCDNPPCVNPDHLRAGTHRENMRDRVERRTSPHLRKTHCPSGHEYDEANTEVRNGRRICKRCTAERKRRRFENGHRDIRKSPAQHTVECPVCGRRFGVRKDGTVFAHAATGIRGDVRCAGSGSFATTVRAELSTLGYEATA